VVEESGSRRGRLLAGAVVLALCGCVLGLGAASAGVAASRLDIGELDVIYTSTSITVRLADGTILRSGGSIPAGSYNVVVQNSGDYMTPRFTFSGPGVNVSSDLDPSGMGMDATSVFGPYTFQAGSTYRIQDTNIGASSLVTFSVTAAAAGSGGSGGSSSGGSSGSSGGSTSGSTSSSGSAQAKLMGTLKASVAASGKPTLTFGGKAVKTLKAGRYTFTVGDHSRQAGLVVGNAAKPAITLSGAAAVETSSRIVTLSRGRWFFAASVRGSKIYFSVK
jgi:hypothetical protein